MDCGEDVEVMAVHLQIGSLPLAVCNVYRGLRNQLEAGGLLLLAIHSNVVAGDFSTQHPLL